MAEITRQQALANIKTLIDSGVKAGAFPDSQSVLTMHQSYLAIVAELNDLTQGRDADAKLIQELKGEVERLTASPGFGK